MKDDKFLGLNKVLCVSPHPDDIEFSMSATVAKYHDTFFYVLVLTTGTSTDPTSGIPRLEEVDNFWKGVGAKNVKVIRPVRHTFEENNTAQWIEYLDACIRIEDIDGIMTPSDIDSHQEHKFVRSIVTACTRALPISLIEYKSPSTLHGWIPNMFIDISKELTYKKIALRSAFESQMDSPYFSGENLDNFHMDYQSAKKGVKQVEQFKILTLYQQ